MTLAHEPRIGLAQPPRSRTFGGLVDELAAALPDAPAISAEGSVTSFGEFKALTDSVARAMLAHGLHKGESVGVLAGNRLEWLVCAMAAAKVGVVVVPLNTFYQADELAYAIAHGDVRTVFYTSALRGRDYGADLRRALDLLARPEYVEAQRFEHDCQRRIALVQIDHPVRRDTGAQPFDEFLSAGRSVPGSRLEEAAAAVEADDLLYIIYTSGSTARPKGVRIHHEPAVVNTFNIGERQGVVATDRSFVASPLFYGLGLLQALGATWTHGACVVLMEVYEPARALDVLERDRCTVFYGLGNMTRSLVQEPGFADRGITLRKGVLGLGPADKALARSELGLAQGVAIYGLTESYGLCATTAWDDPAELSVESIGRALPGWDIRVCDPVTDQPLEAGAVGQILIKGYVTSGYHKDPERNREIFTEDGFFRTGDLGWLDEAGNLYFHSRLSEMMKPGGINVSPLEVENLIGQLPGIGEVHVVGVPAGTDGDHVIAFVASAGPGIDERAVIDHVRRVAAKYKAPSRVFFLDSHLLPRVASGKVPKARLRELAGELLT